MTYLCLYGCLGICSVLHSHLDTYFSLFLFCLFICFQHYSSRPQLTQICATLHLQRHTAIQPLFLSLPPPLCKALLESALILPSTVPSPPITQKQEKHTPTRDWGSDKIKNTRQLIWIKGARSIRIQRDSEPDRETEMDVYRAGKAGIISEKTENDKATETTQHWEELTFS